MITIGFIIICIGIFIMTLIDKEDDRVAKAVKYGGLYVPRIVNQKEYWRLVTANFVHVDIIHIFMNCYAIYYLGSFFEQFLGTVPYIYLLIMSGMGASLLTYTFALKDENQMYHVTLGASGIFYGFLGAMITLGVVYQGPFLTLLQNYAYVIAINLAFTFLDKRISKTGHIGGLIGGAIGMMILMVTIL